MHSYCVKDLLRGEQQVYSCETFSLMMRLWDLDLNSDLLIRQQIYHTSFQNIM